MTNKLLYLLLIVSSGAVDQNEDTQYTDKLHPYHLPAKRVQFNDDIEDIESEEPMNVGSESDVDNGHAVALEESDELNDIDEETDEFDVVMNDEADCRYTSCEVSNYGNENKKLLNLKAIEDARKTKKRKVLSEGYAHHHVERHPDHFARKKRSLENVEKHNSFEQAHEGSFHVNERTKSSVFDIEFN